MAAQSATHKVMESLHFSQGSSLPDIDGQRETKTQRDVKKFGGISRIGLRWVGGGSRIDDMSAAKRKLARRKLSVSHQRRLFAWTWEIRTRRKSRVPTNSLLNAAMCALTGTVKR